ncbi:MAG: hypothetical protein ACK5B9_11630 [Flavobacteriia bacterium]|jgi:hypothetical protein
MSKFGTKEEIVKAIESHFSTMQHGKMSMEDLETLVEQARELYERVLVLRYKAYEEKIFGEAKEVLNPIENTVTESNIVEEIHQAEVESIEQANLPQDESFTFEREADVVDIQEEGEPVFDFSLFDEPIAETQIVTETTFDLTENTAEIEETAINEYVEEEQVIDYASETEIEAVSLEEPTFKQEEIHAVEFTHEIHDFNETPSEEIHEEEFVNELNETPVQETVSTPVYESDQEDIFKHILSSEDNSLGSRLMQSRLDTLIGAFGFNEKFQCIQDLFNGSSDDFNQAIDVLDGMHTFDEAKKQLQFYVRLNNWNLESPITAEFVRKIERRFR